MVLLLTSANTYIHQLFCEMKQPLAIAQALAFTPNILSINKRFAALGICTKQKKFQQQLFQIHQTMEKIVPFVKYGLIQEAVALDNRSIIIVVSPKYEGIKEEFAIKLRFLWQLNNPSIIHAITEKNSHQSREFEGNEIQDIEMGENKVASRSSP
jgi:ABC-type nitrate/sulfonate/bicarbonate transport system ATPase subunit